MTSTDSASAAAERVDSAPPISFGLFLRGALLAAGWFLVLFAPATLILFSVPVAMPSLGGGEGGPGEAQQMNWAPDQAFSLLPSAYLVVIPATVLGLILGGGPAYLLAQVLRRVPNTKLRLFSFWLFGAAIGAGGVLIFLTVIAWIDTLRVSVTVALTLTYALVAGVAVALGYLHVLRRLQRSNRQ